MYATVPAAVGTFALQPASDKAMTPGRIAMSTERGGRTALIALATARRAPIGPARRRRLPRPDVRDQRRDLLVGERTTVVGQPCRHRGSGYATSDDVRHLGVGHARQELLGVECRCADALAHLPVTLGAVERPQLGSGCDLRLLLQRRRVRST